MVTYLVIDTSAVLAVLLDEPSRSALISATEGRGLVGAPSLPSEVGNALIAGFRRRRLSIEAVLQAWAGYQAVRVRLAEIDVPNALEIAVQLGLYAYDAYVLETARAERLPLLTLDGGVARAAHRLGLKLVEVANESV
jgi:predicted nucleic acid-binding protein